MGLFNFWNKPEAAPAPEPLSADQQRIANFLADRDKKQQIQKVIVDLVETTKLLTVQDIAKWRAAWQRALSVEYPSRVELLGVYRDVGIDNHLIGVIGQIKNEVMQKVFKITDRDTEEELPELTKQLLDAQWFIDFCEHVIDSAFFGHSLIQFGDVIEVNGYKKFTETDIVDREHVIPEHNVFVKNTSDHWTKGFDFTQPPYNAWCIGVGKKRDLGIYNLVARHAISKKNMEAFWDKFGQIFGMPIRIGKTNSSNPKDRSDVADMLQKMGAAAWGVFPDTTDIEIKETTRGDAYEVYDKRIERANSEMSKAIVNQTMTTDNGSSKSQGEVHLTIQQKVIEYFARKLRVVINDKLIPVMVIHGFTGPWEKAVYKYDDTVEYTVQEQINIETMVLNAYDVDPEYIKEKYSIPVIGKKAPAPINPTNKSFFD